MAGEQPTDKQIAEALCAADSILSLLHYRHRNELGDQNRADVESAMNTVTALRRWYEPILSGGAEGPSDEVDRLRRFAAQVEGFITERAGYITAIENCSPDNTADYWRWQGHAEARRLLLSSLPWPPDTGDVERIMLAARLTND